ncbi:type II CAAX endopeptidase family protein [Bradyrhizobium sp. NP1]|uniref:CPBP family intramembrane glutamic endopeptidase n=1 Tax=Bradyrhizobium sp. NP1 TaxID=3049772 RepID=UPI0025A4E595|nr:type II CAAX endopeptidase family protein [Bradyrhizobium sp. NP1]WJR81310.1 type II CAAX endopeptidase family protein [Bradyrhizobium sp. NP1]
METTLISLLAYGAFTLIAGFVLFIAVVAHEGANSLSHSQLQTLAMQGRWQGIALTLASPVAIVVLWVAIRRAGRGFSEYLALNWPSSGELLRAFAITAIVVMVGGFLLSFVDSAGRPSLIPILSVQGPGGLLILLIGGCIAAPMMEEFIVRGFMFRGWSQSFLGPVGAIVLTSVVWALNHTQYDWFDRFWIFVLGLALGHFRWRTGSTWLTVIVHSATNIYLFFTMGPYR